MDLKSKQAEQDDGDRDDNEEEDEDEDEDEGDGDGDGEESWTPVFWRHFFSSRLAKLTGRGTSVMGEGEIQGTGPYLA